MRTLSADELSQFHVDHEIDCIAFSSDGKTLAFAYHNYLVTDDVITVWDVATQEKQATFKGEPREALRYLPDRMFGLTFSPDGKTLVYGVHRPGVDEHGYQTGTLAELILRDVQTGRTQARLKHAQPVDTLAFAPDGKALASPTRNGVTLWDVASGQELAVLKAENPGHPEGDSFFLLAFTPDGETLVSCEHVNIPIPTFVPVDSSGDPACRLVLWDVAARQARRSFTVRGHFRSAVMLPDGKTVMMMASYRPAGTTHDCIDLWRMDAR